VSEANQITRRNRGHAVKSVIDELRRYAVGWMNYFGISKTYREVLELDDWIRRRVRLYYWKQWKRPRARRRNLLKLGADPKEVHMATRSRKGYWRMSANSIVQRALNNRWLKEQGVPELRLPCRESGIPWAKPNRSADEGGNDLDQAASRSRGESQSSVI
jgi:RNA-directed DNA polymerase